MQLKKLNIVRRVVALLVLAGIIALFVDPTAQLRHYLGWLPKMQLLPAVLALNVVVVIGVLLCTWLVGRLYCSVVCPLGIVQDLFSRLGGLFLKKRFRYRRAANWVRYVVLGCFVVLMLAGLSGLAMLIAPYGMFGRIASLWQVHEGEMVAVSVVSLVVIAVVSILYGRLWCNTICPVGSLLSLVSRYSLFGIRIDSTKCVGCRQCEKGCKSQCIDIEHKRVDMSRCVDCYNCLGKCKFGALKVGLKTAAPAEQKAEVPVDESRRKFVVATAAVGSAMALQAQEQKFDGGLAVLQQKSVPDRGIPLKPFGARSLKHFGSHCVSCQLCVAHCPEKVLRPSTRLDSLMQPEMSYADGYCRLACNRCSELCPAGAIERIVPEEKTSISIGYAVALHENCLSASGEQCGACARHCPAGAISMVENKSGALVPAVDESRCIGCGACEYYCPARPTTAIYVRGREVHASL